MNPTDKFIVQSTELSKRYYTKCYHDFLDCELLNGEEKMIFLVLKKFIDFKKNDGDVNPSIETIQRMTGWGRKKVIKNINSLEKMGFVKKIRQGLNKPNIYIISDYPEMWGCKNVEDVATITDEYEDRWLKRIAKAKGYTITKERVPASAEPPKELAEPDTQINDAIDRTYDKSKIKECQGRKTERYTLNEIRQLFGYDAMVHDYPNYRKDIDSTMDILYDVLNETRSTIRIAGQDKPTMAVIGRLMKLDNGSIIYAIQKFREKTDRITNPVAYMRSLLFNTPMQYNLDIQNRVAHDMAHWDENENEADDGNFQIQDQ